ncbi:nitrate reductase molybdenum cofactor assembly chaperone [Streptomyces sp. CB02923]|uniref:nitrate reductase molybdenum cofactor assembly chaperone n=1 Tax=Streptomyces sp. CB02923 TaxID=1718985 RepID=UPI00093BE331|nr:nitrate reductase molybdenum cofactor assembly chaperone [Streptomyces sp. CB02923]OKI02227.1 nitrate reductase molybdenum cofactor assembly chaperone [Streptomyces sp. CB02923]
MSTLRTRIRPTAGRRVRPGPEETAQRALLLRLLSLLLQYPDAELTAGRPALTAAVHALPPSAAADELASFTTWFAAQPAETLESHYVEVFDLRRKSSLYLTYYLHGDTRRRGMALLTLAQTYRAAGWDADSGELPDHLPVVLEFAALAGPRAGEAPLRRHRRGLVLIHHALSEARSPYAGPIAALLSLLPPAGAADLEAVARLAAEGPPAEDVGLDPYRGTGFAPPGTFVPPRPAEPTLMPPLTGPMDTETRR